MEWLPVSIEGFSHYVVSDSGLIKNTRTGNAINGWLNADGYQRIKLTNNGRSSLQYVHRIVALAFLDAQEGKTEVHHKNNIRNDNRAENLMWTTHRENMEFVYNRSRKGYDRRIIEPEEIPEEYTSTMAEDPADDLPF